MTHSSLSREELDILRHEAEVAYMVYPGCKSGQYPAFAVLTLLDHYNRAEIYRRELVDLRMCLNEAEQQLARVLRDPDNDSLLGRSQATYESGSSIRKEPLPEEPPG